MKSNATIVKSSAKSPMKSSMKSSAKTSTSDLRRETDSMGEMFVPATALYGATTQRAVLNFPVSFRPVPQAQIEAGNSLGMSQADVTRFVVLPQAFRNVLPPMAGQLIQPNCDGLRG